MPIQVTGPINSSSQSRYHELNHLVMGLIFGIHNDFGRFLPEELVKRELEIRCATEGLGLVQREVGIRVIHDTFRKDYFLDVLVNGELILEIKTVEAISPVHRAQALNYILLAGVQHGTLVNLGPDRVKHEYVSTGLSLEKRQNIQVSDTTWRDVSKEEVALRACLKNAGTFI
jgi:GxxExxY protein